MTKLEKTVGSILITLGCVLLSGILLPVRGNIYAILGSLLLVVIGFYLAFGNLSFKTRTIYILVSLAVVLLFFILGIVYYSHT